MSIILRTSFTPLLISTGLTEKNSTDPLWGPMWGQNWQVPNTLVTLLEVQMGVSKNRGTPKSSILIGFSTINHPFWGTSIFGNTQILPQWSMMCVTNLVGVHDFSLFRWGVINCDQTEGLVHMNFYLKNGGFAGKGDEPQLRIIRFRWNIFFNPKLAEMIPNLRVSDRKVGLSSP